jgi:hypothetical protein
MPGKPRTKQEVTCVPTRLDRIGQGQYGRLRTSNHTLENRCPKGLVGSSPTPSAKWPSETKLSLSTTELGACQRSGRGPDASTQLRLG